MKIHFLKKRILSEIHEVSEFYQEVVFYGQVPGDDGTLERLLVHPNKRRAHTPEELGHGEYRLILMDGVFNFHLDIQELLWSLKPLLSRSDRVAVMMYNPYLRIIYRVLNFLGMRRGDLPTTFITRVDLHDLTKLSGYEVVRTRTIRFPLSELCWLKGVLPSENRPSLSVVIPARNERGNIRPALERLGRWKHSELEIIFVEGHSSDGTWEEIQKLQQEFSPRLQVSSYRQTGKGKNDAVRLGFSKATKDLLTILDADLTMPPELLHRFYEAYRLGVADFINGSRLLYPMEGEAMRFLNKLGNVFFSKMLSFVLSVKISDSLCGTKLLSRRDYLRVVAWRKKFGDFDPFGDFELLFPAAQMPLGIIDIPIRYLARTYGTTNIHRFRHGMMLLKMTFIGFFKIKIK